MFMGNLTAALQYEIDFTADEKNSGVCAVFHGWVPVPGKEVPPSGSDLVAPAGFCRQSAVAPPLADAQLMKLDVHVSHPIGSGRLMVTQGARRWIRQITDDTRWVFGLVAP
jgi:hypothetical protein